MSNRTDCTASLRQFSKKRSPAGPDTVNRIREAYLIDGIDKAVIAEEVGLKPHTVYMIARGLHRRDVPYSPRLEAWLAEQATKREAASEPVEAES